MTSLAFIDYAVSTQQVASTAGDPVPILMPSGVQAGDFLFVVGGNEDLNCLDFTTMTVSGHLVSYMTGGVGASAFQLLCQAPYIFVKRADGSESGTTITFQSQDTTTHSGATRPNVFVAVCYRADTEPITTLTGEYPDQIYTVYTLKSVSGASPLDTRTLGAYPGFMQPGIEARIVGLIASASDSGDPIDTFAVASATWVGLDAHDRSGIHSLEGPMFTGTLNGTSVSAGDFVSLDGGTDFRNENGGVILTGHDGVAGFLHAIGMTFPVSVAYWGINATTPA